MASGGVEPVADEGRGGPFNFFLVFDERVA